MDQFKYKTHTCYWKLVPLFTKIVLSFFMLRNLLPLAIALINSDCIISWTFTWSILELVWNMVYSLVHYGANNTLVCWFLWPPPSNWKYWNKAGGVDSTSSEPIIYCNIVFLHILLTIAWLKADVRQNLD